MTTNENDPRPGRAEGRTDAQMSNRAEPRVVELHYDDQCAPCTDLAQQMMRAVKVDAPGRVRLGLDCTHRGAPPAVAFLDEAGCPRCAEEYRRYLDENPVARALAAWADGTVIHVGECSHRPEEAPR